MRQRSRWTAALLLMLLVSCACTLVLSSRPALADDAVATAHLRVFQEYQVSVSGLQNSFEYEIVPREADAPLPQDDSGESTTEFSLRRSEDLWLEFQVKAEVSPSAEQVVYHYTLQPKQTELADGLYYVDVLSGNLEAGVNIYYLELYVQYSSVSADATIVTPIVHVEGWDGPKVTDPGWRIAYDEGGARPENPGESTNPGEPAGGTSRDPLSNTGDSYDAQLVLSLVAYGLVLLMIALLLQDRRAGECDA